MVLYSPPHGGQCRAVLAASFENGVLRAWSWATNGRVVRVGDNKRCGPVLSKVLCQSSDFFAKITAFLVRVSLSFGAKWVGLSLHVA